MIKRTIEISHRSYLSIKDKQLIIRQQDRQVGQVPMEDIAVIVLNDPSITMTQSVMVASQQNNVALVVCDEKHLPVSTLLPIAEGNRLHNKVLRSQLAIRTSTKKRLWQHIVRHKIGNQAVTLTKAGVNAIPLLAMIEKVKSGDPTNVEAQAARYYWKALFGDAFSRDKDEKGVNALLNYGYSIIRAAVGRAIVGTGLHPSIGLFHQNQYNGLSLADDLMEPFRPWIDNKVLAMKRLTSAPAINQDTKRTLLLTLENKVLYKSKKMPFMVSLGYLAAELKSAHELNLKKLNWPEII